MTSNQNNIKTQLWKRKIEQLLFTSKVCGVCLSNKQEMMHCNDIYRIETENSAKECLLKDIIDDTFGQQVCFY